VSESPARLRSDSVFRCWAAAQVVNVTGSTVSQTVLPILVFQLTRSVVLTSLLAAVEVAPYLVFGLVAGPVADRVPRRALMTRGYGASAAVAAILPAAGWLGRVPVGLVFGCALTVSVLFVFTDAAAFGAYPLLIGRERLPAASGAINSMAAASGVIVPSLAAGAVARWGPTGVLITDAVSYLIAAALLTRIRKPFGPGPPGEGRRRIIRDAAEGLRYIRGQAVLRLLLSVGFVNSLAFGSVGALTVVYGVQALHLAAHSPRLGWLYSASATGSVLASLAFSRLYRRRSPTGLTTAATLAAALTVGGLALVAPLPAALALLLLVFWFAANTVVMTGITYRQTSTPDLLLSRVNVVGRMIAWGGQPAGAAAIGLLASGIGVRPAFAVTAGCLLVAGTTCGAFHCRRVGSGPQGAASVSSAGS